MIVYTNTRVAEVNEGHPVTHSILLAAIHGGEFGPPESHVETARRYITADCVWDGYTHISIIEELTGQMGKTMMEVDDPDLGEVFDTLFPSFREKYPQANPYANYNDVSEPGQISLYYIHGGLDGHSLIFNQLALAARGEIGGDDTVFDYWPSEFGLLVDYAYDLDSIIGGTLHLGVCQAVWDLQAQRINDLDFNEEVTPRP